MNSASKNSLIKRGTLSTAETKYFGVERIPSIIVREALGSHRPMAPEHEQRLGLVRVYTFSGEGKIRQRRAGCHADVHVDHPRVSH